MVTPASRGLIVKGTRPAAAMWPRRGQCLALKDHGRARTLKGLAGWSWGAGTTKGESPHRPCKVGTLPWSCRARPPAAITTISPPPIRERVGPGGTGSRRGHWPLVAALLAISVGLAGCATPNTAAGPAATAAATTTGTSRAATTAAGTSRASKPAPHTTVVTTGAATTTIPPTTAPVTVSATTTAGTSSAATTTPATSSATMVAARPGAERLASVWTIRSVDTMKLSRDTLATPLDNRQIAQVVGLDARLGVTHVTADVYYDAPAYMARWVRAIRAAGLRVWFRAHWYAWDSHRGHPATMSADEYIAKTRLFLQQHSALLRDGDIFDFCSEPENGAYWLRTYGPGWSWHSNEVAKHAFNLFIRAGVRMAATTLAHRGKGGGVVTVVSVNPSIARRLLSKPTIRKLGRITLDLYPEGRTRDPAEAARLLVAQLAAVRRKWPVPIVIGEHGYARDMRVDDATQARVLAAELAALRRLPYLTGFNYWVGAGGPGYGGYTNLYTRVNGAWTPRPAAAVLAHAYAANSR